MKITSGIDIIEVARIAKARDTFGEKFLNRVYAPHELKYALTKPSPTVHLAGLWAAKEAAIKALGAFAPKAMHDITISHLPSGAPNLNIDIPHCSLSLSISHTQHIATAIVTVLWFDD